MFSVKICIPKSNEDSLTAKMTTIRQWLDHRRFEPSIFRHTATSDSFTILVGFKIKAEAEEFATSFDGHDLRVTQLVHNY